MGPVGPGTDGDRPQGKSQLEVVLTVVAVIVGVAPTGAHHIDPDCSRATHVFCIGLFGINILSMAIPSKPLRVKRIIDETPSDEIATRIITVDSTNPVFLARLPKSV